MLTIPIGKGLALPVDEHKLGFRLASDVSAAQTAVLGHMLYIGLKNTLQDAHASVKREDYESGDAGDKAYLADSLALSQKKLDALLSGVLRIKLAGPRAVSHDPVMAELLREARVHVYAKAKGDGRAAYVAKLAEFLKMPGDDEKAVLQAAIAYRITKPERIEAAKAVVAARGELDEAELC